MTALTIATGSLDVSAFLRLGGVFASVMTSNLIFVSLAVVKADATLGKHCAAALLGCIAGCGAGQTIALSVLGQGGVPASGVGAVVLNVTVTQRTAPGILIVYPDGVTRPNSSNLNFVAGQTVPNLVIAPWAPTARSTSTTPPAPFR